MNRKERRAQKRPARPRVPGGDRASPAAELLVEASALQRLGRLDQAVRLYKRALAIEPRNAEAHNNLACALMDMGATDQAAERFARALELSPQLFEHYADIVATAARLSPVLGQAMVRAGQAWPRLSSPDDLFGAEGIGEVIRNPLLRCLLERATIRHFGLEQVLTSVRAWLLGQAEAAAPDDRVDETLLAFGCALARQCFINEYAFDCAPDEAARAAGLSARLSEAARAGERIAPLWVPAVAAYVPLGRIGDAGALVRYAEWPAAVRALLLQQIEEPAEEARIAAGLPRLTPIDDEVSVKVRQQYEENPYPRWVDAAVVPRRQTLGEFVRELLPAASFAAPQGRPIDVLVAGCGTGRHSVEIAASLADARLLAIDLSLASLGYAARKTRAAGMTDIDYAQADILKLGAVGRAFDVIDAGGVLHHMADPMQGWRVLRSLLRPGGFMHFGFYSKLGRRVVTAARAVIAARDDGPAVEARPTPEVIRRCRQELMRSPARDVANFYDFFCISECRDLLFHVQEHQISIPDIKSFVDGNALTFLGFELPAPVRQAYGSRFPADSTMTDLDGWHRFEQDHPDTFAGMYKFWVQATGA